MDCPSIARKLHFCHRQRVCPFHVTLPTQGVKKAPPHHVPVGPRRPVKNAKADGALRKQSKEHRGLPNVF